MLHFIGLFAGNSLVTSEFPAQMASDTENVSFKWCYHDMIALVLMKETWKFGYFKCKFWVQI